MQVWVDIQTVRWAFANAHTVSRSGKVFEDEYGFSIVREADGGSVTRYYSENRKFYTDDDLQILMEFKSEKHLTKFLLRWSCN